MNEELKEWARAQHEKAIHNFNRVNHGDVPDDYSQAFWNGYGIAMQELIHRHGG